MPLGGETIGDPTERVPGFDEKRKYWVAANRLRTRHARTAANLHRWGLKQSPICPRCHAAVESTDHLVLGCPATKLEGGYESVHNCTDTFKSWLDTNNLRV